MEMDPLKCVEMMDAVTHVEPAPLDNPAAMVFALVKQVVLEDSVVMMDVVMNHVESAPPHKPAKMEFVLVPLNLNVQEEFVVTTELADLVEHVPLDKDVVQDNVNVTMIAMKETVVMLLNPTVPILPPAHKDLVVPVLLALPAHRLEDALL